MDKPDRTTANSQTGAAASDARESATQPTRRPWEKPRFERIPLNEALSGTNIESIDGPTTYS